MENSTPNYFCEEYEEFVESYKGFTIHIRRCRKPGESRAEGAAPESSPASPSVGS